MDKSHTPSIDTVVEELCAQVRLWCRQHNTAMYEDGKRYIAEELMPVNTSAHTHPQIREGLYSRLLTELTYMYETQYQWVNLPLDTPYD